MGSPPSKSFSRVCKKAPHVWAEGVACRLIESVMLRVAISPIYVRRTTVNNPPQYEVLDGHQRCTTLVSFYGDERPPFWKKREGSRLFGCDRASWLNDRHFQDLPKGLQAHFLSYQLGLMDVGWLSNDAVGELLKRLGENAVGAVSDPQAPGAGGEPLPDSTDFERDAFRENAHFTGTSSIGLRERFTRYRQPTDSIRLLAGH